MPGLAHDFGENLRAGALAAAELKDTGAGLDDAVPGIEDIEAVFGLGIFDLYLWLARHLDSIASDLGRK